jgi:arylsulfatase A-like enzyme
MNPALFLYLVACGPADYAETTRPVSADYQNPAVDSTGATPVLAMYRTPGSYTLPDHSRPAQVGDNTRFVLQPTPSGAGTYKAKLPFDVGSQGRRFSPTGMVVTVDDVPVMYGKTGSKSWHVKGDSLQLNWPKKRVGQLIVDWPQLAKKLQRRSFAQADLEDHAFVRWSMTLDDYTRDGMMLPAPATAKWQATLPAGTVTFDAWMALDSSPLITELSDGATAVLEVVTSDETVEVSRHKLPKVSTDFSHWQVDLSAWAGNAVTVQLRTETGPTADHDYVFLGSASIWGTPTADVRRIVVIGLDTTRPDHFGLYGSQRDTSPQLDAIAANSVVFDNGWTPAPRTRPSFRSATTGRYPLNAIGATNIGEVFQDNNFATAGIVANVHLQPRFDFHHGFDLWRFSENQDGNDAGDQIDRAMDWMRANKERDTYLFLHLMDPHVFYGAPGAFHSKFVPEDAEPLEKKLSRWAVTKKDKAGRLTDGNKAYLEGLYDGEISYMSHQLGRFFAELDDLGGNTLVIVHSDHGEEFWEHGGYEHNHTLYADTTKAFFVIRPGGGFKGGRRVDTPVTLADIAPTLYDFAGFPEADWPDLDGRSLRPLVEGDSSGDWSRPIGVAHLRYGSERWAVIFDGHKYILHTDSGQEELYDLTADPGEHVDLTRTGQQTTPYWKAMALAHEMPVGPGWRLRVDARAHSKPFTIELPEAPLAVVLIDPERTVTAPSNQSWGEPPTRTCDEIGVVAWEKGSTSFTWTPGTQPRDGLIMVLWDHVVSPEGGVALSREGEDSPLEMAKLGPDWLWRGGGASIRIDPGVVFVPRPGEAQVIRERLGSAGEADASSLEMLEALGYLGDDEADADDEDAPNNDEDAPVDDPPGAAEEAAPKEAGGTDAAPSATESVCH